MDLGHIDEGDRKILYSLGALAVLLLFGLTVTGVWQFFNHTPTSSLSGYVVGLDRHRAPQIRRVSRGRTVSWVTLPAS